VNDSAHLRHELRTPLNHIIGYAEMLLEDSAEPDLAQDLQAVLTDARTLLTTLNQALAPVEGRSAPTDLAPLRAALTPLLERMHARAGTVRERAARAGGDALLADLDRIGSAIERLGTILEHGGAPPAERDRQANGRDADTATQTAPQILVVDDNEGNRDMLARRLARQGYELHTAGGGQAALDLLAKQAVDLVLLDVMMPDLDGYAVLQRLKADPALRHIPVLMISALDEIDSVVRCIRLGADDYLTKPFEPVLLQARVGACLEKKRLHDQEARQAARLADLNRTLERRVAEQVGQLERLARLKRFFSPQLAEAIVAGGADDPLKTHRREITVVFLDLRGFTAFAETAEPEDVMDLLREYHAEMGRLILTHEGTLERFTGDGMMIFFNDPVEVPNPAERAVRMAVAMRDRVEQLGTGWRKRGWDLGLGVGIARGYATIGAIGFEGRRDYGAIGTVTNMAARLCGEAHAGQILVSGHVAAAVETLIEANEVGALSLKGLARPVSTWDVVRLLD
jgi:adenylate cyclase